MITPGQASTWAILSLLNDGLSVITWVGGNGQRWPLSGGLAPMPPTPGVLLKDIKGLHATFSHIDEQGAHQDGVTNLDTSYDKTEVDMTLEFQAQDHRTQRRVFREWLAGWDPHIPGKLVWYTEELGEWWVPLRLLNAPGDVLSLGAVQSREMAWAARADFPFWQSFDSTSKFAPVASSDSGFLPLWNRGTIDGWPRYICQGPGTFNIGDNGGPATISITLKLGQTVLLTTVPNKRSVRELTTNENLYPLLKGRFATALKQGAAVQIPISVTGASPGKTVIAASLTPYRRWPE